jgi:hypothetical protein
MVRRPRCAAASLEIFLVRLRAAALGLLPEALPGKGFLQFGRSGL